MDDLKKGLCNRINQRINVRGYCVVYDHELGHIWPPEAALREKQIQLIERFAEQNGLAVTIRDTGINATFKKKAAPHASEAGFKNAARFQVANAGFVQQDSRKITSFRRPHFQRTRLTLASERRRSVEKGHLSYQLLLRLSGDCISARKIKLSRCSIREP
ncbi:MAG: hypothetical protein ACXWIU_14550, partial [Limisphaerales bacterium]